MKMKLESATPDQEAFQAALKKTLGEEGKSLDSVVILAVVANFLGQIAAVQDKRKFTGPMVVEIVSQNFEYGNQQAVMEIIARNLEFKPGDGGG